jgi:hypothetical protein
MSQVQHSRRIEAVVALNRDELAAVAAGAEYLRGFSTFLGASDDFPTEMRRIAATLESIAPSSSRPRPRRHSA